MKSRRVKCECDLKEPLIFFKSHTTLPSKVFDKLLVDSTMELLGRPIQGKEIDVDIILVVVTIKWRLGKQIPSRTWFELPDFFGQCTKN